jgi:hypothetical protein
MRLSICLLLATALFSACSSSKKEEKIALTPEGEKIRIEENLSALVGCRLLSEIRVHTKDTEDGMNLLRNTAAAKGAQVITDLEWGRGEKDGKTMLISKAEAYQCR